MFGPHLLIQFSLELCLFSVRTWPIAFPNHVFLDTVQFSSPASTSMQTNPPPLLDSALPCSLPVVPPTRTVFAPHVFNHGARLKTRGAHLAVGLKRKVNLYWLPPCVRRRVRLSLSCTGEYEPEALSAVDDVHSPAWVPPSSGPVSGAPLALLNLAWT